jgi:hypothetical protein
MMDAPIPPERPAYGTPTVYSAIVRPASNGIATGALIVGIVAACFGLSVPIPLLGLLSAIIAAPLGILAVALGFPGLSRAKSLGMGRGSALAGIILGFFALGITVVVTLGWIVAIAAGAAEPTPTPTPF